MRAAVSAAAPALALWLALGGSTSAGDAGPACAEARGLLLAGDSEAAEARFAAIAAGEAPPACAVQGRVDALLALDRWDQALAWARARYRDGAPPEVAAALAEALYRAGRLDDAEALLDSRSDEAGLPGAALSLLGLLRLASGRVEQAGALMERAVGTSPADRRVWIRAAEAAPSRAEAARRLRRYLDLAAGDDADRIEAARGSIATLTALGERELWRSASRPARLEVPLQLVGLEEGRLLGAVVRVRLGEGRKAARLLLDSGSSGLFLVERMARKGGFEALATETAFGGGGDQRHRAPRGVLPRFELDGLVLLDALVTTTDAELDPTGRFHGVLGLSVFEGYRVEIDYRRRRLVLDTEAAETAGSRYWTIAGQMLVGASARGGPEGLFLFDTGAGSSVLDLGYAERVPGITLREASAMRAYGGAIERTYRAEGASLSFQGLDGGDATPRAIDLSLRSRLGGVQLSGYLGLDLFDGRRVVVDTRSRQVRLEAAD